MLALLILVPLFVKNFVIFQLTMLLIYGLAVLALNILTGGSGQFSLGQSAFYAVGAYTSAILMEHAGMNYALTLRRGPGLLRIRLRLRPAGVAAFRRLSRAGDVRAGHRDAAAVETRLLRALDRRRAGPGRDQAGRAVFYFFYI
jgi:ABC-type branched-chain amino acid transport system, permease component